MVVSIKMRFFKTEVYMKTHTLVKIPAQAAYSYPIIIGSGTHQLLPEWLAKHHAAKEIVIITDNTVKKLYAADLQRCLIRAGYEVLLCAFPAGEKSKNAQVKNALDEQILHHGCGRDTICLALGGGVVGDLAGYVAATYMRGIPFLQMPTTLLAMIDSSVGGKTGINSPQGKNLIGAFWQPSAVMADIDCLRTLSQKQLIHGLVEAIKIFLTSDKKSLAYTQKNLVRILAGDAKILQQVVQRAVRLKAYVVEVDEKETNMRRVLNFGHTIGHALEKLTHYKMLHGFAVGLGILLEAKVAELQGLLSWQDYAVIARIFADLGIRPAGLKKFAIADIIAATQLDKKVKAGKVQYVLLQGLGNVYQGKGMFAHPVTDEVIKQAYLALV